MNEKEKETVERIVKSALLDCFNQKDAMKSVMKDAMREWLDEKYAQWGKWSMHSVLASVLAWLLYMIFVVKTGSSPAVPK